MKWLFNFSASPVGGGLRRLVETAKWFDQRGGATFLVPLQIVDNIGPQSNHNRFIGVQQSKLKRLLADGMYLSDAIEETGIPDVYFSYGIPLFYRVGRTNWLHATNALTLTRTRHGMPLKRYIEHQILGGRIRHSICNAQIVSAESEFSLALLKETTEESRRRCRFLVLENGCDESLRRRIESSQPNSTGSYAITVGTAPYKRLDLARLMFHALKKSITGLDRFRIVGDKRQISPEVLRDPCVDVRDSGVPDDEFYRMLQEANCYISASAIENSSIAALEGLLLSRSVALSDIPPHREMLRNLVTSEFRLPGHGTFLLVDGSKNRNHIRVPSWSDILSKMNSFVTEFAQRGH